MGILFILFFGQCVVAIVVVFVLKHLLDKELIRSALEKFESCRSSSDIKEISVCCASVMSDELKGQLESIRQRKMPQAHLNYQQDAALKGGIVITLGDTLLDFSFRSRLHHFWS